jgi:cytochrome c biogenesis protein CcmG, thiol:disulfide interchange protein DsbE
MSGMSGVKGADIAEVPTAPGRSSPVPSGPEVPSRGRRHRTVLWAALAAAAVVAVLIAVIASAQPSSEVEANSPLIGNAAPPIAGPGLAGGRSSLAQLRGKWVLVNFMASWCDACRQEMPQLLAFAKQHAKLGDAGVLMVEYDPSDAEHLKTYLTTRGATWPTVNDPAATVSYGLTGIPSSFLVSPSGIVYAYLVGAVRASELDSWLQQGAAKGYGRA